MKNSESRMMAASLVLLSAGFFFALSATLKDISEDMMIFFIAGSVLCFSTGTLVFVRLYKFMEGDDE